MPAAGYIKRTYTGPRKWENPDASPFNDVLDCSRGEIRLAAEVTLAELRGHHVPDYAHDRASHTLKIMARS